MHNVLEGKLKKQRSTYLCLVTEIQNHKILINPFRIQKLQYLETTVRDK